jgi:hypothetical protein
LQTPKSRPTVAAGATSDGCRENGCCDPARRGVDDYMNVYTGVITAHIAKRSASRAYKPAGHLVARLGELEDKHAEIKVLLTR